MYSNVIEVIFNTYLYYILLQWRGRGWRVKGSLKQFYIFLQHPKCPKFYSLNTYFDLYAIFKNQDTWKDLLIATQKCEQLYKDVKYGIEHENLLPKFSLALLQQQLAAGKRTDAVAKTVETRLQQIQRREVRVRIAGRK